MKKILVPCDFSKAAVQAYMFACRLATAGKGELHVLHAFELPMTYESAFGVQPYMFDEALITSIEERARENFYKMKDTLDVKPPKAVFKVVHGSVTTSIIQAIESTQADLVVMGTNGASGLREFFVGSNTEKIVRLSPVPVIAVREDVDPKSIKNIVLPSTMGLDQGRFIEKVKELQAFFGARLHLLLVNTPTRFNLDSEAQQLVEDFATHYRLTNYTVNVRNDHFEHDGIRRFVEELAADMVVMATHGRRGLAHMLAGSITEDIVNHIECPIWTFNMRAPAP